MPTTYAHWYFGQQCLEKMPKNIQEIINNHRDLYDIGVHGPDIFFYDLLHKEIEKQAPALHKTPARVFFENAVKVYNDNPDKDEMLAYLLGFLTHFTFDSQAHGYIERKKEVSGITHNKVESDYDGYLMRKQGRTVNLVDRSESLKPSRRNTRIIARFFPFDETTMFRVCRFHRFVISSLNCFSPFRYRLAVKLLDLTGSDHNRDLPVAFEETDICRDSNLRLVKLQAKALKLYPSLYRNLMDALNKNKKLSPYFDHNFEPWEDYQEIPVLSYEEELKYKV